MATTALDREVRRYRHAGFALISRTDRSVQLVREKRFSLVWFFIGLGILYLPWYMAKGDDAVVLELQPNGSVKRRGAKVGGWR